MSSNSASPAKAAEAAPEHSDDESGNDPTSVLNALSQSDEPINGDKRALDTGSGNEDSAQPRHKKSRTASHPSRDEGTPSPSLTIRKIVDFRFDTVARKAVYRVQWDSSSSSSSRRDTWEPLEALGDGAERHLEAFFARCEKRGRYFVENILNHKGDGEKGETSYLVKWHRYPGADTWEPGRTLKKDCPELIAAYHGRWIGAHDARDDAQGSSDADEQQEQEDHGSVHQEDKNSGSISGEDDRVSGDAGEQEQEQDSVNTFE